MDDEITGDCHDPCRVSIRLNYANMEIVEQGLNKSISLEGVTGGAITGGR